ncbi:MAG: DUF2179 domain-containing protein [Bacteroidales bacterium]|nr:DUF2179 domain-containing protein [Bacteroidales bacterium]MCF8454807.1 DUF2179 domain-containing protein [Bacteroidales bacterium]
MELLGFISADSWWFTWVILPLLIFLARISDQTIGTLRLIFVSKGFKTLAPVLGFFESIIWLLAVSQIMQHLDNAICFITYGGGFAMGNYIGILLEEKLSIGKVIVRIIPKHDTSELTKFMNENGFGHTRLLAEGSTGPVNVIISIIDRKDLKNLVDIINRFNPNAFYSVEDVKAVKEGVFRGGTRKRFFKQLGGVKKVK